MDKSSGRCGLLSLVRNFLQEHSRSLISSGEKKLVNVSKNISKTMLYHLLKNITETTLVHYRCQECQSMISEQDLSLNSVSTKGIDYHIKCPKCSTEAIVHAEVANFEKSEQSKMVSPGINDADILQVRQELQSKKSVNDLLND